MENIFLVLRDISCASALRLCYWSNLMLKNKESMMRFKFHNVGVKGNDVIW